MQAVKHHPTPTEQLPRGRLDPELGPVRVCVQCNEEWPHDAEFFARSGWLRDGRPKLSTVCIACSVEGFRTRVGEAPRVTA